MQKFTFLIAILLYCIIAANGQNDTLYFMKGESIINRQSIKQIDLDSIKFSNSDTITFVKNNLIVNKQSIKPTDIDSIIFYKPIIGSSNTITDYDGNVYNTVTIGTQIWMKENLKTTHYANGVAIPLVSGSSNWDALTSANEAYCWHSDDIANKATYGALYTWAAAMKAGLSSTYNPSGVQGVCPTGWHLPSDAEWTQLTDFLGGTTASVVKLKSTTGWYNGGNGTNESGFTAYPAGVRNSSGLFNYIGINSRWWCATETNSIMALDRLMGYNLNDLESYSVDKTFGYSVRCLKD
ncbi:MAG TPA: hypothetical protein DCM02_09715 [Flavobacterium sp.]|nr:hypothetical protein [Flavobacterium sp.]